MRGSRVIALLLVLTLSIITLAHSQESYKAESLIVKVFQDGAVEIEYTIIPSEYLPMVNISLFGKSFEYITIFNEKKVLLDFDIKNNTLEVYTLGSEKVIILYTTYDLTNKTGIIWTLSFKAPIEVTILLPKNAAITGLSDIPMAITLSEKGTVIVMKEGEITIDYTFSSLAIKEVARLVIKEAEDLINKVMKRGVNVSDAISLLEKAKDEYSKGNYEEAERIAEESVKIAKVVNSTFTKLHETIKEIKSSVPSRDVLKMIQKAENLTRQGKYEEAQKIVEEAKTHDKERIWIIARIEVIGLIIGTGLVVAGLIILRKVRKVKREREVRKVNVKKIFQARPQLRQDDREVIEYLAQAGGEAFESEVRNKFKFPKTTVWRMIKRLEREEIVEVRKVGGQNLVRIKDEFAS